jgi:hypothetical protein
VPDAALPKQMRGGKIGREQFSKSLPVSPKKTQTAPRASGAEGKASRTKTSQFSFDYKTGKVVKGTGGGREGVRKERERDGKFNF